ncbi:MAG: rRNA pseudouridine synthase [Planctomycetota bacterium]|nr:MAG: rRNA pseudouridine synthase [Planctomycetota bacterium]
MSDSRGKQGTGPERLQKLLARAGYGSRRKCEELITEGRVTVDGAEVTELGAKADPHQQDVRVDGRRLRLEDFVYYLVNKPKGVVCTSSDPQRRRTVLDLVPNERRRIFSVGRLDYESKGAVILTNDGAFSNLLTHPRYGVEKTYSVRVRGAVEPEAVERLRRGVWLAEGRTLPAKVWVIRRRRNETDLGVTLCEGKNRQVRRMFAKCGYKVLSLTRTKIGTLSLKGLAEGAARRLETAEVAALRRQALRNAQAPRSRPTGRRSRARSQGKPDPRGAAAAVGSGPVRSKGRTRRGGRRR